MIYGSNPTWDTKFKYLVVKESSLSRCTWTAEHVGSDPTYQTKKGYQRERDLCKWKCVDK